MYLSEESGLGANKKWVHRRRGIAGSGSAPSGTAGLGHVGAPVLDVPCPDPPGCAPLAAGDCRRAVRDAVREAIRLATIAANKLDALVKMPVDMRDADGQRTAKLFTFFFGHDPLHPISWAGNQESGQEAEASPHMKESSCGRSCGREHAARLIGSSSHGRDGFARAFSNASA